MSKELFKEAIYKIAEDEMLLKVLVNKNTAPKDSFGDRFGRNVKENFMHGTNVKSKMNILPTGKVRYSTTHKGIGRLNDEITARNDYGDLLKHLSKRKGEESEEEYLVRDNKRIEEYIKDMKKGNKRVGLAALAGAALVPAVFAAAKKPQYIPLAALGGALGGASLGGAYKGLINDPRAKRRYVGQMNEDERNYLRNIFINDAKEISQKATKAQKLEALSYRYVY